VIDECILVILIFKVDSSHSTTSSYSGLELITITSTRSGADDRGRIFPEFLVGGPLTRDWRSNFIGIAVFVLHAAIVCHGGPRFHTTHVPELLVAKESHTLIVRVCRSSVHFISRSVFSKESAVSNGAYPKLIGCEQKSQLLKQGRITSYQRSRK
jgi:hypothetical protein